ncbi:MAG: radical SAM protein [bacterium]|nr:radical SAM protein [bacterium]
MKIFLVNPPAPRHTDFLLTSDRCQPLSIAYLASFLKANNFEVLILDAAALHLSPSEIVKEIKSIKPDVLGITAVTYNFSQAAKIAKLAKRIKNPPLTILGGPHVTAMPSCIKTSSFDFGVIGEGEETLLELVSKIKSRQKDLTKVQGLVFKRGHKLIITPSRPYIQNLDRLPFPSRELFPLLNNYHPGPGMFQNLPVAGMITSRGCPFKCTFCDHSVFGQIFRARSFKNVVDEMELLIKDFKAKEIKIWDDTFNLDPERVIAICREILKRKLKFTWKCLCRVNFVNKKMLKLMKKAGCWQIAYGIESGNDQILETIKKGLNKEIVRQAVKLTKEAGIETRGFFILGLPGETEETLRETIDFAKELDLETADFNSLIPFPGTEIYNQRKRLGHVINRSFDYYFPSMSDQLVFIPHHLNPQVLKKYLNKARFEFYFRPSYILKRIIKTKSIAQARSYFQALKIIAR